MEAKDEEDEFKAAVDRIKNNKSSDMLKMLEKSFLKKSYKYKEKDLKKLLKMISDKMKKLGEELMETKFAPRMIDKLRKEYGNLDKMTYKQGEKLKNMVDKYPKEVLQQLAKEKIEWISMFASLKLSKLERGE